MSKGQLILVGCTNGTVVYRCTSYSNGFFKWALMPHQAVRETPPISGGVYFEVHQRDNRSSIGGILSSTGDISLLLNSNEVIFSDCYKTTTFIIGVNNE